MTLLHACCGESMAAKLDQLTALVQSMEANPRNPHSDIIITAIVCFTILAIAWIVLSIIRGMRKDAMLHEKEMEYEKRAWEKKTIARETLGVYRQKKLAAIEKSTKPDDPTIKEIEKLIERLEKELEN